MKKTVMDFLEIGVLNNTIYYPNTYKKTKDYLMMIKPMIDEIDSIDEDELLDYIEENQLNIYALSICISILQLDDITYDIIEDNIRDYKDLSIFLWFYTLMNGNKKDAYLNKLLIDKAVLIKDNTGELFKVYKPSYSCRNRIIKRMKNKYKLKYMISSQENMYEIISLIQELKVRPIDIHVEMGFTFDKEVKNDIVNYFLDTQSIIDMIYFIDRWYIDDIPKIILDHVEREINNLTSDIDLFKLFILNTSLEHKDLSDLIYGRIRELDKADTNRVNVNYVPYMNSSIKWDGLHTYNSYVASITALMNSKYDMKINIKDKSIDNTSSENVYEEVLNNSSFSLKKCESICKTDIPSVLFSNEMIEGYDILWDVSEESCPLFNNNGYVYIVGKNELLIDIFLNYILSQNEIEHYKHRQVKVNKDDDIDEDNSITTKERVIDKLEEIMTMAKEKAESIKFNIKMK